MTSFTTDALVIASRRFSEADRILVLLTSERGKIPAIAKSVRKSNSKMQGATQMFVHARFELAEGKSLAILRHAEVINPHLGLRDDWKKLQLAGHVAEIAGKMSEEHHPDKDLYNLTLEALDGVDSGRPDAVAKFKVGLLDHMGVFPDLSGCAKCGAGRVSGDIHLAETGGGFLCAKCAKAEGTYHPIPMKVLHVIHKLRTGEPIPADVEKETIDLADDLLTVLLQSFLQAGFKTVAAERQARRAANNTGKSRDECADGIPGENE